MAKYTGFDTPILDSFIDHFKEKYNPALYEADYAKFLELVNSMLSDTRAEFETKFVGDVEEQEER